MFSMRAKDRRFAHRRILETRMAPDTGQVLRKYLSKDWLAAPLLKGSLWGHEEERGA